MAKTMTTARFHAAKDVHVDEISVPEVGEEQVRIRLDKGDFASAIDAIATSEIQPKDTITKVLSIDQVDAGFKALVEDKDNQIVKIMIDLGKLRN
ncbi:uncharacterized protein AB675_8774 [Cyphellophora attinorum]|uniref:Uncharacterized protein n=1 Tax=Cyphellophora attinorum TaxID=1664694 RepID=A0A0N0NR59_9EURO|nr:uncharacterized protein AB675_8774 [Phialophora attinorum]KPI44708.1 hypothetical protein AB675_8774 [Phialophora attinorum]